MIHSQTGEEASVPREGGFSSSVLMREPRFVWLLFARLALTLTAFAVALGLEGLGWELSEGERRGLFWTLSVAFFFVAVSGLALRRGQGRSGGLPAVLEVAVDVAIVTALVVFSGCADSPLAFLYAVVTLYGAVLFEWRGALAAAALSAVAYGLVLTLGPATGSVSVLLGTWAVQVAAVAMIGALASILSAELRRTGAALARSTRDLQRLHDLHRRTVESLMSGLLTSDRAGRVTSLNPEGERITGASADEMMGADVDTLIPGTREIMSSAEAEAETEPVRRARLAYRSRYGDALHLGLAASILRDAEGAADGHIVIFQDVSAVVAMEEELRQSERMAAVGEMAAKIAHEIRNPLASISGSVQLLQGDLGSGGGREPEKLMDIVVREVDRLNGLISDFLGYARPGPARREAVSVAAAVEDVLSMLRATASTRHTIESHVDRGLGVWADPDQLRQLLWNLCANGLQAMPEGGGLSVRARVAGCHPPQAPEGRGRNADKGPVMVEIAVSDTGGGIGPEVRERLFEPFFTTKADGTGLGLAIVHRIVESHEAELSVESEPGMGATFKVRISSAAGSWGDE